MSTFRYPKRKRKTDIADDHSQVERRTASKRPSRAGSEDSRGRRLIPAVVDDLALIHPGQLWIKVAHDEKGSMVFQDITYETLANAVNRTASWLRMVLGEGKGKVVAYLGPSDTRYLLLAVAAAKINCSMFFPSPFNPSEVQRQLLKDTSSVAFLHDVFMASTGSMITRGTAMVVRAVPSQADLLDFKPVPTVSYEEPYALMRNKAFLTLHTSGTTGTPKPVTLPHGYYSYEDQSRTSLFTDGLNVITSASFAAGTTCFVTAPMWHAGGVFFGLLKPILNSLVAVLPPTGLPITAGLVHSCLASSKAELLQVAPSVAAELAAEPTYAPTVSALRAIIVGSGPLSAASGSKLLSLNANTLHFFGATETDLIPLMRLDDPVLDWQYHHFHPLSGASFEALGDGLFELVFKHLDAVPQPCFEVYPDAQTFETRDIFSQHPSKRDLWKFEGRLDVVVTFSTGEKLSPVAFEDAVLAIPCVTGALIFGTGRSEAGLLLETDDSLEQPNAVDLLWPDVETANTLLPTYGQVRQPLIFVTRQPFMRTPKGTTKRSETEQYFRDQIDALYQAYQDHNAESPTLHVSTSEEDIHAFVQSAHAATADVKIHADADIFAAGMDSMKIAKMVFSLNKGLAKADDPAARATRVTASHVYAHRSISGIAKVLHSHIDHAKRNRTEEMPIDHGHLLQEHIGRLSRTAVISHHLRSPETSLDTVMLTGSTGALGTHLLYRLLRETSVRQIHCLDRSASARDVYLETFPEDAMLTAKVSFHQVKYLNDARCGLSQRTYNDIHNSVTKILHNAWPVNFQMPLETSDPTDVEAETLNPHVGSVTDLVGFASTARNRPRIVFISSIAAVLRHKGAIPEAVLQDPSVPERSGYAQSKWMGEQVLEAAAETHRIRRPMIIRIGQIAGPLPHVEVVKGSGSVWDKKQVIPSLILSSLPIHALPRSLGEKNKLRWTPVDVCAKAVLELAARNEDAGLLKGADVYNLTNLSTAGNELTWTVHILPLVERRLTAKSTGRAVPVVPLAEWYDRMLNYGPKSDNPAFKLLDFYEDLVSSDEHAGLGASIVVDKARAASEAFGNLGPVQTHWMEYWMEGWGL